MSWITHLVAFGAGVAVTAIVGSVMAIEYVRDQSHRLWMEGYRNGQSVERGWWAGRFKLLEPVNQKEP